MAVVVGDATGGVAVAVAVAVAVGVGEGVSVEGVQLLRKLAMSGADSRSERATSAA